MTESRKNLVFEQAFEDHLNADLVCHLSRHLDSHPTPPSATEVTVATFPTTSYPSVTAMPITNKPLSRSRV